MSDLDVRRRIVQADIHLANGDLAAAHDELAAALAESRPSDGLAAAVIEWADSEEVVRQNPSPSREEWHRVLVARERLRELRAALTEPDSAETPNP
jgi:hypothetical protein